MNKAAKLILLTLIGLPLTLLLVVIGFFLIKDANDFKPTIESQAKNAAGINLEINGDLSWSLFPLGLDIHEITIKDQDLKEFASASRILASIDLWSLFDGAPRVQTILLDGLKLNLVKTSETQNNWSNILPPNDESADAASAEGATTETVVIESAETDSAKKENTLNFLVESLQLINTTVSFDSKPDELLLNIEPLNLTLSNITFDQAFPISMDFALSEQKNQLKLESTLNAQLTMSKDLSKFKLERLETNSIIKAPEYIEDELRLAVNTNVTADTKAEIINISELALAINQLRLTANANIKNYSEDLSVTAKIDVPSFSPKKLLADLKIALPSMQASDALERLILSADIALEKQVLKVDKLKLQLDESNFSGQLSRVLAEEPAKQATTIKLRGDKLNLDRYLPPESDSQAETAPPTAQTPNAANSELLPLETLRNLNLDLSLIQDALSIKNVQTTNISLSVTAKNGKLNQALKGTLYEGTYYLENRLDAQSNTPRLTSEQNITNLNLEPLMTKLNIEALKEYGSIKGLLNVQGTVNASGNQLDALQTSAKGKLDFNIDQGSFDGISLNAMTCTGLALINRETLDTSSWPKATPFNTLKGAATLENEQLSTDFDIITAGVHADSQGVINLEQSELNIKAALKVIGETVDKACRVNEKLKDIGIPVLCKGKFDTPPAELCKLDTSRLGDMAKQLAVEEGKRKINKEVDRALEKHLGGEEKAPVKSLLKKLIQ